MLSFSNYLNGHPNNRISISTWVVVTYFILGVALFLCNLWTPPINDDYYFSLRLASVRGLTESGVEKTVTWYQLLESLGLHWFYDNFRLGNILTRIIVFIENGKGWLFALLNTLAFLTMISCLAKLVFKKLSVFSLLTTTAFFILFCPAFEPTCLWLAGSLNYLWGGCMLSIFLLAFHYLECGRAPRNRYILICTIFSGLTAWSHESLGGPLIGALIIYYVITGRQKRYILRILLPSIIMLLLVLSSRGVLGRVVYGSLTTTFLDSAQAVVFTSLPYILIVLILSLCFKQSIKRSWKHLLFWITLFELLLYAYTGGKATWGIAGPAYFPHLCLMICTLFLIRDVLERLTRFVTTGSGVIAAGCLAASVLHSFELKTYYNQVLQSIKQGATTVVIDDISPTDETPWMLRLSLPLDPHDCIYPDFPYFYHCQPTLVVVNRLVTDKDIYSRFSESKPDTIQTMRHGDFVIFRLPSPWFFSTGGRKQIGEATTANGGKCYWCNLQYPSVIDRLESPYRKMTPLFSWGRDYHDGHHYVLFEMPESAQCETMHLRIINLNSMEERVIAVPVTGPSEVNINDSERIEFVKPVSRHLPWMD